jgi:hypothetical protein
MCSQPVSATNLSHQAGSTVCEIAEDPCWGGQLAVRVV